MGRADIYCDVQEMKWKRRLLRAMLGVFILFDLLLFVQFQQHGWPAVISGHDLGEGRMEISVTRIPISAADSVIDAFLVCIQAFIVYACWRIDHPVATSKK